MELWKSNNFTDIRDSLRSLRQSKGRDSANVLQFGRQILKQNAGSLDSIEYWELHEQVFVAALDENELQYAKELVLKMKKQFGDQSLRVRRLVGLFKEAEEKYAEADEIYKGILEKDPTNSQAMKRQIAIRKALRDYNSAIKLLNDYLKIFMGDTDAWQELADLHLHQQQYKSALSCYEEILLAMPHNFHHFSRYAEILYTLATNYDGYRLARKYFAQSLELSGEPIAKTNPRALYGLLMTTVAVAGTKQGKTDRDNVSLFEFAYSKLETEYKATDPSKLPLLRAYTLRDNNNTNNASDSNNNNAVEE